jgi:DNA-directed RNA polymerase subunit M/transcription elongation factor TFIIS
VTKWTPEYRKQVRDQRIADGRCIDCSALMLPEWPQLVYCPMCKETRDISAKRYRSSRKGMKVSRIRNRRRRADPVYLASENKRAQERFLQRKIDGICRQCKEPSTDDSLHCAYHKEKANAASREAWRRKAARAKGLSVPTPKRELKKVDRFRRPKVVESAVEIVTSTPVEDFENGDLKLAEAAIRYAELCNGITVREIGDAFAADHPMRDRITHVIGRALKKGRLVVGLPGDVEGLTGDRRIYPNRQNRRAA